MRSFIQKNRNHIGILTSVYLTAIIYKHYATKQFLKVADATSERHMEERMESWRKGYDDAKREYNRHPHLYCETCIKQMSNH